MKRRNNRSQKEKAEAKSKQWLPKDDISRETGYGPGNKFKARVVYEGTASSSSGTTAKAAPVARPAGSILGLDGATVKAVAMLRERRAMAKAAEPHLPEQGDQLRFYNPQIFASGGYDPGHSLEELRRAGYRSPQEGMSLARQRKL